MKKTMTICFFVLLSLLFSAPVFAANLYDCYADITKEDLKGSVILAIGSQISFVDGQEHTDGDPPISKSGRTLVPVRYISEALGAKVDWDKPTNQVTVQQGDCVIKMTLGRKEMTINGVKKTLDVPVKTFQNRTYLPLRAIGEALSKSVIYCDKEKVVIIRNPNGAAIESSFYGFPTLCSWLCQGWDNIVYGDNILCILKKDGQLYIAHGWYANPEWHELLSAYDSSEDKRNLVLPWHRTPYGDFFIYDNWMNEESGRDYLYKVEGEKITRICGHWIASIQFTKDAIYLNTEFGPTRQSGAAASDVNSNLWRYDMKDFSETNLGVPGFIYGYDDGGEFPLQTKWYVKADGIYITGMPRHSHWEGSKTGYGFYKVNFTGNSHLKVVE